MIWKTVSRMMTSGVLKKRLCVYDDVAVAVRQVAPDLMERVAPR